ncbi:hypothetical protein, partial [Streptomyces viridochromogenes]
MSEIPAKATESEDPSDGARAKAAGERAYDTQASRGDSHGTRATRASHDTQGTGESRSGTSDSGGTGASDSPGPYASDTPAPAV